MKQLKINKNYLLLKNWWESIDLTNYEKSYFNKEIIPEFIFDSFTCQNVLNEIITLIKDKKRRQEQVKNMKLFSKGMLYKDKNPSDIFIKEILSI